MCVDSSDQWHYWLPISLSIKSCCDSLLEAWSYRQLLQLLKWRSSHTLSHTCSYSDCEVVYTVMNDTCNRYGTRNQVHLRHPKIENRSYLLHSESKLEFVITASHMGLCTLAGFRCSANISTLLTTRRHSVRFALPRRIHMQLAITWSRFLS